MTAPTDFCNIKPPEIIAQRAIDCAWVLTEDYLDRLPLEAQVLAYAVRFAALDAISWRYAGAMFALHSAVVGRRV